MDKYYIIEFSYPDSHVEEINQEFPNLAKAIEFAKGMIIQVENTESYYNPVYGEKDPKKPHYMIYEVNDGNRKLVKKGRE